MKKKPNIAIVGATGVVGSTFLKSVQEKKGTSLLKIYT